MLEAFLHRLAEEAGKELDAETAAALVAETRGHLEESIQARLELGIEPERAEREAIQAFGEAQRTARGVAAEAARPRESKRGKVLAAAYALFIVGVVIGPDFMRLSPALYYAVYGLAWILVLAFGVLAFRSRRPAPRRVLSIGLIATLGLWGGIGTTWLHLWHHGGMGETPRWHASDRYAGEDRTSEGRERREERNAAVAAAQADPMGNFLAFGPETLAIGIVVAGIGTALDGAASGLGILAFSLRRRARGGGARA